MQEYYPQNLGGFAALVSSEPDEQWDCISCPQDLGEKKDILVLRLHCNSSKNPDF